MFVKTNSNFTKIRDDPMVPKVNEARTSLKKRYFALFMGGGLGIEPRCSHILTLTLENGA